LFCITFFFLSGRNKKKVMSWYHWWLYWCDSRNYKADYRQL